jgi:hypothetical protein
MEEVGAQSWAEQGQQQDTYIRPSSAVIPMQDVRTPQKMTLHSGSSPSVGYVGSKGSHMLGKAQRIPVHTPIGLQGPAAAHHHTPNSITYLDLSAKKGAPIPTTPISAVKGYLQPTAASV